jgi:two-component sensor histidine kinase
MLKDVALAPVERSMSPDWDGVQLHGRWLLLARLLWIMVVPAFLSYFLFFFVTTFSSQWGQVRVGFDGQTLWKVLGFTDDVSIAVLCPLLWCAIGTFLFWQTWNKENQPVALIVLFVSLTLMTTGLALASALDPKIGLPSVLDPELSIPPSLSSPNPLESFPISLHLLANSFLLLFPDGRFWPRWMLVPVCLFLLLAASSLVSQHPEEAVALLQTIKGQLRSTIADLRRLVYALRPPVLDEFGLISALREHTIPSQQGSGVQISLSVPEELPPLSAATEVAAFRIVEEALTNVVRHAQAQHCQICLELTDTAELMITITDTGKGLPQTSQASVGMHSMRERAEELGGSWTVQTLPTGGTRVRVSLPLSKEELSVKEEQIWNPPVS